MAKKISELKLQADIGFLISVALEASNSKKLTQEEKSEIATCFENIKSKATFLPLVESGLKTLHSTYDDFLNTPTNGAFSKAKWLKGLNLLQSKNKPLVEYLASIIKTQNISIPKLQETSFFKNVVEDKNIFFSLSPEVYSAFLSDIIDITSPRPIAEKTAFISSFIKTKMKAFHRNEMSHYFFDNADSEQFKTNFAFSPPFLSLMLKSRVQRAAFSEEGLNLENLSLVTENIKKLNLSPADEFEKSITIFFYNVKSNERQIIKELMDAPSAPECTILWSLEEANKEIEKSLETIDAVLDYAKTNSITLSNKTHNFLFSNAIMFFGATLRSITESYETFFDDMMELSTEKEKIEYLDFHPQEVEKALTALLATVDRLNKYKASSKAQYEGTILAKEFKNDFSSKKLQEKIIGTLTDKFDIAGCDSGVESVIAIDNKLKLNKAIKAPTINKTPITHKI